MIKCDNKECDMYRKDEPDRCVFIDDVTTCTEYEPLKEKQAASSGPFSEGLEGRFFMERRVPHLLNIAEELLTWCIEEDKKGIYKGLLQNYRKEYEDIIEKAA